MLYISIKHFKRDGIDGFFDIPPASTLHKLGNSLFFNARQVCIATSAVAHNFFARNDDGNGLLRGKFSHVIIDTLNRNPDLWQLVWHDSTCLKFRRSEFPDYWLWSHDFYNAPIEDLQYIAALIGLKGF